MNAHNIASEIYQSAIEIPEPFASLSEADKQLARELLAQFEAAEAKYEALPHRDLLRPMLLSKNGRYTEALFVTEESYQQDPGWETAIAAASAARRAGNWERAVAMLNKASEHDPTDETCYLDMGDMHLEQDRHADALAAYERALALDPRHQWALPSAFYCRHRLGVEGNWLASLQEVAQQEGCTCGLEGCLTTLFGSYGSERGIERAKYLLAKLGSPAG